MFLAFSSMRLRIQLPSRPPWWNACYTRYEAPVGATVLVPGFDGALGGFSTDSRKLRESGASKSSTGVCSPDSGESSAKVISSQVHHLQSRNFAEVLSSTKSWCRMLDHFSIGSIQKWTVESYPENGHCRYISMRTIHDKALDVFFLQYIRTNPTWFC